MQTIEQDIFDLLHSAMALVEKLDGMTSKEFSCGQDREEREDLRQAILRLNDPVEFSVKERKAFKEEMARESNRRRGEGGAVRR